MLDFNIDTTDPTAQGGPLSGPNSVRRKQALAAALMRQGMDTAPAAGGKYGGVLTALNRGLAGAFGGYQSGQLDREEPMPISNSRVFSEIPGPGP
jgi:hypothetical protein